MAASSAFVTSTLRSIRGSLGRFLAIVGITALGCGFYAGLKMCGPDMRSAADAWYDASRVWDLRLVSTMGWSDEDVSRISRIDGIDAVMPATTVDAMARLGGEQVAVRISTLDMAVAAAATPLGAASVSSADDAYLNRVRLVEGSWPRAPTECVVCADAVTPGFGVGSAVEVLSTASGSEDLLRVRDFDVVGTVTAASYPYTANFGSTTLGAGMVEQYLYVMPAAMAEGAAYTDIFALAVGAEGHESESEAYEGTVGAVADGVEDLSASLMASRLADVRRDAQVELDERTSELEDARSDARAKLEEGRAKLDGGASELADGQRRLADAEAEYAEGVATYERERAAAQKRLASAEAELRDAERELAAGEAELSAGEERLSAGEAELAAHMDELLSSLSSQGLPAGSLDEAASSVAAARAEADFAAARLAEEADGISQLQAAKADLVAAEEQAGALAAVYGGMAADLTARGYANANVGAAVAAEPGWAEEFAAWAYQQGASDEVVARAYEMAGCAQQLIALLGKLDAGKATVAGQEGELLFSLSSQGLPAGSLDEAAASVAAARAETDLAAARLAEAAGGISQLQAARAELEAGRAELRSAAERLSSGRAQLASGRAELASGRDEADRQLAAAASQLEEGAAAIASSRAEWEAGRAEWEEGHAAWEASKAEADAGFADADAQLVSAQAEIDALAPGELYVLDRTKSEGAATYHADTERMDAIAAVFPFMFFLVAALIALTTMTRMVEDERTQIGTYKALGYSTASIAGRYLAYAAAASVTGAVVGVAVLSQVLPMIVTSAYGIIYAVPSLVYPLPVSLPVALASGGLGVGVTLVATWAAVVASLREAPATLMLPRAPAAGRRILLERVGALWRRLSFSWKVTCRNLFRYKRRLLMTVVGVSGCTALLLVGFGLHDAIWDIIDCQYGPIIHYDTTVALDETATEADVAEVESYLTETGEVADIIRVRSENMQASDGGDGAAMRVQVVVPTTADALADAVTLRERAGRSVIPFDERAVVITEKLATKYGIAVGDPIVLFEQDATGNAVGTGHSLDVTGIAENYVGNLVYVGRHAWRTVSPGMPVFSTLHATTTPDDTVRAAITDALHDFGHVSTVAFSDETINMYRTMLSVVDMIVVVLVVSAAALAFIVLYNLTNINVAERVREIASLKVLGFTRREVFAYVFREIFLLAVLGAALGMAVGTWLATFVVTTAEVDYVMFGRTIHPASYAYAFVLTLVFTVVIALAMRKKLDHVGMIESLKSVE